MLAIKATTDKVLLELQKYGGTVYQTSFSNEDEEKLKKAWKHEQVSTSADEMLELDSGSGPGDWYISEPRSPIATPQNPKN
jgi:hypothetical protein